MSDTQYEFNDPVLNASQVVWDAGWLAQTFTIGTTGDNVSHNITSIKISLGKRTGEVGTVTLSIRAVDGDNKPTGADLTSGTTNGNTLPEGENYETREFVMTPYLLQASTMYAMCLRTEIGNPECIYWEYNSAGSSYAGGVAYFSFDSGATWSILGTGVDFGFFEYGLPLGGAAPPEVVESILDTNKSLGNEQYINTIISGTDVYTNIIYY